jgi:peptidoglycan/xylan/chitin deacetylase (PgdA/CDA1 family)
MGFNSFAQQKQVCITVDDLPVVRYGRPTQAFLEEVTNKLIATFDAYSIPAIGYVNEKKLYVNGKVDQNRVHLLELWLGAGYELGNHTYSHPSYHRTSFEDFTKDIMKGEVITRSLTKKHDKDLKFFRHPFLQIGKTKSAADSLSSFLESRGYHEAPVTIDPDDYLFAKSYQTALNGGDSVLSKKIGKAYLTHMESKIHFYENVSQHLFGENIAHTLLIHANLLNADYLDEVAEIFKQNSYTFISQKEVLEDKLYQEPITKFGNWGISWMDRWTISQKKYDLLKNDPLVPEFITKKK